MKNELVYILGVIIIFQLLLIAWFLFTQKKGNRLRNSILAVFFLAIALNISDGLLFILGGYKHYPALVFWGNSLSFVVGPLLYLYTVSIVYKDFRLQKKHLLHLIPFLLTFLFLLFTYHLQPLATKKMILASREKGIGPPAVVYIALGLNYLQVLGYILLCFREIGKYRQALREQFSSVKEKNLAWLSYMLYTFTLILFSSLVNSVAEFTILKIYYPFTLAAIILVLFLFITNVLFKALKQPELFAGIEAEAPPPAEIPVKKYVGSSLAKEEREKYLQQLLQLMVAEKPYLEPELNLEQLAKKINLPARTLSQVINESCSQSFFDFVNQFRIEEAKKLLAGPDKKITVAEVLYQVGFNSKSSFNTAFKKLTDTTPSEYKKARQSRF